MLLFSSALPFVQPPWKPLFQLKCLIIPAIEQVFTAPWLLTQNASTDCSSGRSRRLSGDAGKAEYVQRLFNN